MLWRVGGESAGSPRVPPRGTRAMSRPARRVSIQLPARTPELTTVARRGHRSPWAGENSTMPRRYACQEGDLDPGASMTVPGPVPIALFRNEDGEFYATADTCTHEKWSLGEDSDLEGNEVTCPLHMARFDITTGKALCLPATVDLDTFAVEVDADG